MEQVLNEILNELKEIKQTQVETNTRLDKLETKVDSIKDQLTEFEAKTANYHIETTNSFNEVTESIDFLTHKENQTEKDVYTIKKKLQVIK